MARSADLAEEQRRADFVRNYDRIIEGATAALGENPSASMAEIAERSGVVRATLYRHFPAREDLLREIYHRALKEIDAAIQGAEPEEGKATEALEREIEAFLGVLDRYRVLIERRPNFPELRPEADATFQVFDTLVARGQKEGLIRGDLTGAWLSTVVVMVCVSAVQAVDEDRLAAPDAVEAAKKTLLAALAA
ncbi:MAG: helix-turn-helix domain-containing protein [Solirubrobacterales bacterium]